MPDCWISLINANAYDNRDTTDEHGQYQVTNLRVGCSYEIRVQAGRYRYLIDKVPFVPSAEQNYERDYVMQHLALPTFTDKNQPSCDTTVSDAPNWCEDTINEFVRFLLPCALVSSFTSDIKGGWQKRYSSTSMAYSIGIGYYGPQRLEEWKDMPNYSFQEIWVNDRPIKVCTFKWPEPIERPYVAFATTSTNENDAPLIVTFDAATEQGYTLFNTTLHSICFPTNGP